MVDDIRAEIQSALKELQDYRGSEQYAVTVKLLAMLEAYYYNDFFNVTKDNLDKKQGAAQQIHLLRMQLINPSGGDLPLV